MGKVGNYKDLIAWQKGMDLVEVVYRVSRSFPADERFGLVSQIRRAAISVPSNIAEGCGRKSEKEFARFLSIAAGSTSEAEYQILLARDLGYLDHDAYDHLNQLVNEVKKMLNALIQKLKANG